MAQWVNTSKIGTVSYLVEVDGQPRYVHIEHLRVRDIRSMPIPVAEPTSTDAVEVNIPDTEIPLSITEQTSKSLKVPLQIVQDPLPSNQLAEVTTVKEAANVTEETPGRRHPKRQNRQIPVRYRST